MVNLQLDSIPSELLASIAGYTDARSILCLSATNHALRAACYNVLVLRSLIQTSLEAQSPTGQIDMSAIVRRAGTDTGIWARFAHASDLAAAFGQVSFHGDYKDARSADWLVELLVVNHPIIHAPGIRPLLLAHTQYFMSPMNLIKQRFGRTLQNITALLEDPALATNEEMQDFNTWHQGWDAWPPDVDEVYRCIGMMATYVCNGSQKVRQAWPYDHHAVVPHIRTPDLSLFFMTTASDVPVPFTNRVALDGERDGTWSRWQEQQGRELLRSGGTWCGYYSGWSHQMIDPPMMNINFVVGDPDAQQMSTITADECIDGHGTFDITGEFNWADLTFRGRKQYTSASMRNVRWRWYLKLTPLGWHGYWADNDPDHRIGLVWLWKQAWSPSPRPRSLFGSKS